jgi:hypothetical protein
MITWGAGMHWTGTERAWCGFFANLIDGRVLLRHEMTWRNEVPERAAKDIVLRLKVLGVIPPSAAFADTFKPTARFTGVVANPDLWPKDAKAYGQCVAETFSRAGVPMRKGNGDRVNGWSRTRSWLAPQTWPNGSVSPALLIHPDCTIIVRSLPMLIANPKTPDDVLETVEEYPANGLRYYAMSRPVPSVADVPELPPGAIGHSLRALRAELDSATD